MADLGGNRGHRGDARSTDLSQHVVHLNRLHTVQSMLRVWRDSALELDLLDTALFWGNKVLSIALNVKRTTRAAELVLAHDSAIPPNVAAQYLVNTLSPVRDSKFVVYPMDGGADSGVVLDPFDALLSELDSSSPDNKVSSLQFTTQDDDDIYVLARVLIAKDEFLRAEHLLEITGAADRNIKCRLAAAKAASKQHKFDVALDWIIKDDILVHTAANTPFSENDGMVDRGMDAEFKLHGDASSSSPADSDDPSPASSAENDAELDFGRKSDKTKVVDPVLPIDEEDDMTSWQSVDAKRSSSSLSLINQSHLVKRRRKYTAKDTNENDTLEESQSPPRARLTDNTHQQSITPMSTTRRVRSSAPVKTNNSMLPRPIIFDKAQTNSNNRSHNVELLPTPETSSRGKPIMVSVVVNNKTGAKERHHPSGNDDETSNRFAASVGISPQLKVILDNPSHIFNKLLCPEKTRVEGNRPLTTYIDSVHLYKMVDRMLTNIDDNVVVTKRGLYDAIGFSPISTAATKAVMKGRVYHMRSETMYAQREYESAIRSDIRCIEAWKWLLKNYCLTPLEQRQFVNSLRNNVKIVDDSQNYNDTSSTIPNSGDDIRESTELKLTQLQFDFILAFYIVMADFAFTLYNTDDYEGKDVDSITPTGANETRKRKSNAAESAKELSEFLESSVASYLREMKLVNSSLNSVVNAVLKNPSNSIEEKSNVETPTQKRTRDFADINIELATSNDGMNVNDDMYGADLLSKSRASTFLNSRHSVLDEYLKTGEIRKLLSKPIASSVNLVEKLEVTFGLQGNSDLIISKAKRLFNARKHMQCFEILDKLLSQDMFNMDAIVLHVCNMREIGNTNYLFLFTHRLVEQHPKWCVSWFAVGVYYLVIRNNLEARKYFTKATMMEPRFGEAWVAFAISFAEEGEIDQALSAFGTTMRYFKGMYEPLVFVAIQCAQITNYKLAKEYLRQAMSISECMDPTVLNEMGSIACKEGDFDSAERLLRAALIVLSECEIMPSTWEVVWFNLAYALRRLGKHSEALKCLERVLVLNQSNADVYLNLGINYQMLGDYQTALEHYHKAMALDPYTAVIRDCYMMCIENWPK